MREFRDQAPPRELLDQFQPRFIEDVIAEPLPDEEPASDSDETPLNLASKEFIYRRTVDIQPSDMMVFDPYGPYSKMLHRREDLSPESPKEKTQALFVVRTLEPASQKSKQQELGVLKSGNQVSREYIAYSDLQVAKTEKLRALEEEIRAKNKRERLKAKKREYVKKKKAKQVEISKPNNFDLLIREHISFE